MATAPTSLPEDRPSHFFGIGEIRKPTDEDFQYFVSLSENHDGWIQKCNKSNVKVWMKDIPGVTVKMLKVHALFENVEPAVMFDALEDPVYRQHWDEAVISDETVCRIDGCESDICYYAMKCPAPLRNRDFIAQRCWRTKQDEYIVFNHSVEHQQYPPTPLFVRGLSYITGYILKKTDKGTFFSYVTHSDPRGNVPKWLLNIVASKIAPRITFRLEKAGEQYLQWKANRNLSPEVVNGIDIPVVSLESLQLQQKEGIPETDEPTLKHTETIPNGVSLDLLLNSNSSNTTEL